MKNLRTVMLVVMLLLVPVYAFSANLAYMRISLIEGDVQIKTPDTDDWGYTSINAPLAEGDQIWAPQDGRIELQLDSGTYIRLSENSALQILSLDNDSSQFYLSQGSAYIYYDAPRRSVIQVDTPDASTRAFKKAIFRIDVSDQYTDVSAYKGRVETENQAGKTSIRAGEMVSLGQNTNGELAPIGPSDDWEIWNKMRNDRLAGRGASSRYLPVELGAYSYDFDRSGRWVRVPDYGYVWTPTVAVGESWSPYREGRWIWRGDDYVWVASEPWGWAPYHYGRWSFGVNIGWFWVPPVTKQVYWSPGYVGWVRTADYVAWVPLAPGEIYYGRGNYGRNSVNITNMNINQVNITVYKNVKVNNGVTVVNRSSFNTGTPTIVNVNKNIIQEKIFTKNNISVGRPDIKPTKESYFASTRQIHPAKLPPQSVRNLQVKELKHSRPLIKDQDRSVLTPGVTPKSLPVNTVTTPRTPGKAKPMIKQVMPEEKKPSAPEGFPAGRGEQQKQQAKPEDRMKPSGPVVSPADRGGKEQVKPEEKKPEKREIKPEEKKPSAPEGFPAGRGEQQKQQAKPEDRMKPSGPVVSPADRGGKEQVKPEEKKPEKREIKPEEKKKPSAPEGGIEKKDKKKPEEREVKPAEKKKPAGTEGNREKKDKKKLEELDESPQNGKKKQGENEPAR